MTSRYFKVCHRGFANEVTYFEVPEDKAAECETLFKGFPEEHPEGYCGWTSDTAATLPGVAVAWADRAYVLAQ